MIELAAAATVAALIASAVDSFDKIYRGYSDFIKKQEPATFEVPPPDLAYMDSPESKAFVAQDRETGRVSQTVTYEELRNKLSKQDLEHIETLSSAMESYQMQWSAAFTQRAMASGMDIGRMDAQLKYLAEEISKVLLRILEFIQKLGFWLDDHYGAAHDMAREFLKEQPA